MSAQKQKDTPEIDAFDPAVRTVADRIYYAMCRVQLLRQLFDRDGDSLELDSFALLGLDDAFKDIERALEPLAEGHGVLPDKLFVRDVLLPDDRGRREGFVKSRRGV